MHRTESARHRVKPDAGPPARSVTSSQANLADIPVPNEIVEYLDRFIIGQSDAKRAIAVALRNRHRRQLVDAEHRYEIRPANLLMIGPTGVGKTEIARRVAKLVGAPFLKVEATRFTEVGFVGKDVESIIRDLAEIAVSTLYRERAEEVREQAVERAEAQLLDVLVEQEMAEWETSRARQSERQDHESARKAEQAARRRWSKTRREWAEKLANGEADTAEVEIAVDDRGSVMPSVDPGSPEEEMQSALLDMMDGLLPSGNERRRVTVREARRLLEQEVTERLVNTESVIEEALSLVETAGVVFVDEIDKAIAPDDAAGAEISSGGVQRDLLPLLEGTLVQTRYGAVRTDHILFVGSGAFHGVRPSDLIPELQGRFPVRVELQSLSEDDLHEVLTRAEYSLTWQYGQLLQTEGITVAFEEDATRRIAQLAAQINSRQDDIGARRLQSLMERLLEDVLFDAPELGSDTVTVAVDMVNERVGDDLDDEDLALYIL